MKDALKRKLTSMGNVIYGQKEIIIKLKKTFSRKLRYILRGTSKGELDKENIVQKIQKIFN